ncbi:hypothetical protein FJ492_00695 [Mesorhizobium sp. B2-5-4]|uniref:hypothetical protein n=1 Tax=Mesorhizobium sp. B2-5-4 TaxID=2589926 RepID=UPI0011283F5E|nr:hypothetical protein [Mesorhizobium sp. B2-5-4]TPK49645.1 hypothetical protein FJ492_00695 [Mesorhizobium sp. B2-5-4]
MNIGHPYELLTHGDHKHVFDIEFALGKGGQDGEAVAFSNVRLLACGVKAFDKRRKEPLINQIRSSPDHLLKVRPAVSYLLGQARSRVQAMNRVVRSLDKHASHH